MLEKQTPGYLTAELDSLLSIKVGGVVFYIGHLKVSLDVYLTLFYRLKPNNWLAAFEQSDMTSQEWTVQSRPER